MIRKYDYVLFDLDGTLTDPAEGIFRCFRVGLSSVGLEEPDDQRLRRVIGPPLSHSYAQFYGLDEARTQAAIAAYRAEFSQRGLYENRVYDGVPQLLARLRENGVRTLVATSKPQEFAQRILEHFGLARQLDFIAGATMDSSRNSKEAVINHALAQIPQADKARVLMVGDRFYDLEGARQHGLDGAGVLYGYGDREELSAHHPVFLAQTPRELGDFILGTESGGTPMQTERELRAYARSSSWTDVPPTDQDKGLPAPPVTVPFDPAAVLVDLPDPKGCPLQNNPLFTDIERRRSNRVYQDQPISLDELSFLLYCSDGYQRMRPGSSFATLRTVPSAGARHPLETYLAVFAVAGLEPGLYRYLPLTNQLLLVETRDAASLRQAVIQATGGQKFAGMGAVTFFWAADMYRCEWRYSTHAHKLVLLDVGHICQNLYLACEEVGCGCCAIAAYQQEACDKLFGLDGDNDFVVYLAPVGKVE